MSNESNEGTAVATTDDSPRLNKGAREAVADLSAQGRNNLERRQEIASLSKMIAGMEWGSGSSVVSGAAFSEATRYAFAEFCRVTRANPHIHVDILGGKPYLNANYYADLCNTDPSFIRHEQFAITPGVEAAYRQEAERALADAATLNNAGDEHGAEEARADAARLLSMARRAVVARHLFGVPETAKAAYETVITRYVNGAPIERILSGEVSSEGYVKEVREANWAGVGDTSDPVGEKDSQTTARTRSFRRAARFAFPAWMANKEEDIRRAERMIEADFEIIQEERTASQTALPRPGEVQAVASDGEPTARNAAGAHDLPTHGEARPTEPAPAPAAPEPTAEPAEEDAPWDPEDARKRFFATLREAGIEQDSRKEWQAKHNLPESTKDWGQDEYHRANTILITPTIEAVGEAAEVLGVANIAAFAAEKLGHEPDTLRDWKQVLSHLNALADAPEQTAAL